MKAMVIGETGGIGKALADTLEKQGAAVVRLSRSSVPPVDFDRPQTIGEAAGSLAASGPFDLILLATGLLHDGDVRPEKSMRQIEPAQLDRYFRINATGPALVMRHFLPLLPRDRRGIFAALSARVGSIGDNRLGGWVGYRASKAALNQIIRTLSIELARTSPSSILVGLHPGTVNTALSKPFQRNVPEDRLLEPSDSAERLIRVLDGLRPADSGACFDWAGTRIPH